MEIKSIWDGWEKQCFNACYDKVGGSCAMAYAADNDFYAYYNSGVRGRVAAYIRTYYALPTGDVSDASGQTLHLSCDGELIIYANNVLKLTPGRFREIDRLTQIEAAVKPLVESVDVQGELKLAEVSQVTA